jgi:protein CpxP
MRFAHSRGVGFFSLALSPLGCPLQLYKGLLPGNGDFTKPLHTCFQPVANPGSRQKSPLFFRSSHMASPRTPFKSLVLAGLLATLGAAAFAADAPPPPPPAAASGMAKHDPAKMQEHMLKRQADLKAKLKLTAAQEPAWTTFSASMQPPARGPRPDKAAMEKLTTPERIDKMRAMHAERSAQMEKRGEATKAFYAALSPEQQKVFDANAMPHGGPGEHGGPGRHHKS